MGWKPIRCVVFDWGGVILKHHRCWADACASAGIESRPGHEATELIMQRRQLNQRFQAGQISSDEFYPALAAATGGLYTAAEVRRIHDAWLTEEYPGVDAVIRRLAGIASVETGMLSNTNACHWKRHSDFPTAGLLKHRYASHLLGFAKPALEIFRAFERETGFSGTDILFFDDLPDNIAAARTCGWHGEVIDHTGDTAAQIAAHLTRYEVW